LREALAEMEAEQCALNAGIEAIRVIIAGFEQRGESTINAVPTRVGRGPGQRSYIDDGIEIFQAIGKPMHIMDMTTRLSEMRGKPIDRASVESSFIRHSNKAVNPRIVKFGRSTFGLSEWKQPQPTLAQTA